MAARLTAYLVVAIVAVTFIAGLIVGAQRDDSDGPVDLIVQNAAVYTADRRGTMAEAVAVRGNQILRVGSNREIARLQRPQTLVLDAKGGAVVPGLNDAHVRLFEAGLGLAPADLTGAGTTSATLERIAAWSVAHPASPWVVGRGWTPAQFRSGLPSRQLLDTAVADRPALIFGADERSIWVNSRALKLAGITRRTPDPDGGVIIRESHSGEPTGVLQGAATELVKTLVPAPPPDVRAAALRQAIGAANARGITSVQVVDASAEALELLDGLRKMDDLPLRIYSATPVTRPLMEPDLEALNAVRARYPDDPVIKAGALSIALDRPIVPGGAAVPAPATEVTAAAAGETTFAADDLNRTVRLADAAGWQIVIHASGERAARMALTALAHAARSNRLPARGRRHRIDGLSRMDPADLGRFEPLGVIASVAPDGPAPTATFAFATLAGHARLVFGSDAPLHALDPLAALHTLTTDTPQPGDRSSDDRQQPRPALALKSAIDAYTATPAWASFDEQRKGSIAPGMLADFVVLSENVFDTAEGGLLSASVVATIVDGKIVYRRTLRAETDPAPAPEPSLQH